MPAWRQTSLTGTPASACLRIETIWVSVNRDFFMEPPGYKDARKFCFQGVYGSGELTHQGLREAAYAATAIMSRTLSCEASSRIGAASALLRCPVRNRISSRTM